MAIDERSEWCRLGAKLRLLCPEKYVEILDALRETVDAHEIMSADAWMLSCDAPRSAPQS